ncbi:hypothetical protein [Raoultella ornithinolytica]|uniref:hypothetical protein n=1 Tax=Raoultella ornithinolytica TaxID=54291 RepID=UPI001F2FFFF1|nr:hypothetical protein [Raoultella ornithinolytica]MCF6709477.1 hypothetical protein [Raoultella ornithinolytica]
MAENNFKPFATTAGANVATQAEWEALIALSTGFTAGIARSGQINKALRQATVIASVLAQFIADKSESDVLDDGDTSKLLNQLIQALNASGDSRYLRVSNYLLEVQEGGSGAQSNARGYLGLGNSATSSVGSTAGTVAAGDDSRITGAMQKASNLNDLPDKSASRTNLGLGAMATKDNPPFINEIGACALAWYDGAVNYNATVSGTLLFPSTADGNHATVPLTGTWRCLGQTETINDQHRTTLWQRIS